MSEHTPNPNASKDGAPHAARKLTCEEWEAMLVDFLDGALPSSETVDLHAHRQSCASCAEMFSHAGQGQQWLTFLRKEPEVSPALVGRILAQTSGAAEHAGPRAVPVSDLASPLQPTPAVPFWHRSGMASAGRRVAQPRLLMTAAMAFFSITLTMNMAGVRLSSLRAADLKPTVLAGNLKKQCFMASASVVRYYDNLRFVYEMEARVKEMRRDADLNETPSDQQSQPATPAAPDGGNHKNGGKSEAPRNQQPQATLWGEPMNAGLRRPDSAFERQRPVDCGNSAQCAQEKENAERDVAGQAERGMA